MSKYIKLEDAIGCECPFMEIYEDCINCPLYNGGSEVCEMGKWLKSLPTIEVNEDAINNGAISSDYIEGYREAVQRLEKFYLGEAKARSVTTEQSSKVGEWKPFDRTWGREMWACSVCGESVANMPTSGDKPLYDYCPNCGAKMLVKDMNVPNKEGVEE